MHIYLCDKDPVNGESKICNSGGRIILTRAKHTKQGENHNRKKLDIKKTQECKLLMMIDIRTHLAGSSHILLYFLPANSARWLKEEEVF